MKIIEPKVELWSEEGVTPVQHIARCARVCYGHDGEGKDPKKLVEGLIKMGHKSMLRHASKYYLFRGILPNNAAYWLDVCPYDHKYDANLTDFFLSTNLQEKLYSENFNYVGYERELSPSDLLDECKKHSQMFNIFRLTFCITTQISTARELNRVSPNNIAERSTRYCSSKDGLEICKPWWYDDENATPSLMELARLPIREKIFAVAWHDAENAYKTAISEGFKPEDARGILPLDTATKVVYTYSAEEWKHIIDLRYYGKTGKPHPNAKIAIGMVRDQINNFAKEHGINYKL